MPLMNVLNAMVCLGVSLWLGGTECARCEGHMINSPALGITVITSMLSALCCLMGRIDGVGPKELKFENLMARLSDDLVTEVILATNFTPEGQATAYAIELLLEEQDSLKKKKVSRLARGVPHGAELEFTDLGTIAQAVRERKTG